MYPETPDFTQEQKEIIDYWLKIAGKDGKGCRSGPKEAESEIFRVFGVPKEYFEEDLSHNASIQPE